MWSLLRRSCGQTPPRRTTNKSWIEHSSLSSVQLNKAHLAQHLSCCYQQRASLHTKVLVANRGEIACRILRTCQKLEIPTVAIYSSADANALHVKMANEAYQIGTSPAPTDSYLLQDDIINIAIQSNAQAIHPGYGFLSENATFARKIEQTQGLTLIGPPSSAMTAMGSKQTSKAIMEQAGVPCTPGYSGDNQDPLVLLQHAREMGFPVLIKAWHGGGGKGMRLVWDESEFSSSLQACQNEAQSAFGNSNVLLEKYLHLPRHIEVQVIADSYGNVVHLYERDCSVQRRHQKILEEAPASDLPTTLRQELGEMAKKAAQAVGYVNAGTVEFLLSNDAQHYYFCEMNTRLQVEHPVTEQITGIDLVEWQLRIAAGETLPLQQEEIPCYGHALEARVYAENPAKGFLPSTGTVWHHHPPAPINTGLSADGVRVDSGLENGQQVGVYYDPMISKLIVHSDTRDQAITAMSRALKQYQIAGVTTNLDFLIQCVEHPKFVQAGEINTGFLEETNLLTTTDGAEDREDLARVTSPLRLPSPLAQAIGTLAVTLWLENRVAGSESGASNWSSPWSSKSGSWRMGGLEGRARRQLQLVDADGSEASNQRSMSIECISNRDGSIEVVPCSAEEPDVDSQQGSNPIHVDGHWNRENGMMEVVLNGTKRMKLTCVLHDCGDNGHDDNSIIRIRMWPQMGWMSGDNEYAMSLDVRHPYRPPRLPSDGGSAGASRGSGHGIVKSPMPGKISRVNCVVGDSVEIGQVVVVMEAMKMEHSIKAPCAGRIHEMRYQPGDVVDDGAILFVIRNNEEEHDKAET